MTDKNVEPLLPVELGPGKVKFAQGMKAGRWVFATGLMAQDFKNGIAPDVLAEQAPHAGMPKREKEAQRIFENLDAVRAVLTEKRLALLGLVRERAPKSVAELARMAKRDFKSIYRDVEALRELGLIKVAGTRRGVSSRLRSNATEIVLRIAV